MAGACQSAPSTRSSKTWESRWTPVDRHSPHTQPSLNLQMNHQTQDLCIKEPLLSLSLLFFFTTNHALHSSPRDPSHITIYTHQRTSFTKRYPDQLPPMMKTSTDITIHREPVNYPSRLMSRWGSPNRMLPNTPPPQTSRCR